jgi:RNA polymerase sigma factor (sigma-70 family)
MANTTLSAAVGRIKRAAGRGDLARATDGELLARFVARRDEEAFAALLSKHGPMVLGVGRRVLGHEQDAEDVYQATFLVLARKAGSVRKRDAVASWLHGVAHRLALKARGQAASRRAHERNAAGMRAEVDGTPRAWLDFEAALDGALLRLPEQHRAALILCYLEGLSHEEAARRLGCAVGTVGSWVARGRNQLRAALAGQGIALTAGALATALVAGGAAPNEALFGATLRAGLAFADGAAPAGASAGAAALAQAGPTAASAAKLCGSLLALALTAGALALTHRDSPRAANPPAAQSSEAPKAKADLFGDPLPEGAVARIGTTRLRHGDFINSLAFSPDGKRLHSVGQDGLRVWEADTGREVRRLTEIPGARFIFFTVSPDGKYAAASHLDSSGIVKPAAVSLWDVSSGSKVKELGKGEYSLRRFSPDGKVLAVGRYDGWAELWDISSGKQMAAWRAHKDSVRSLAFSRDGKAVMTGGYGDKAVRFWDATTGQPLRRLDNVINTEYSLALSPDGKTLACIDHLDTPLMMRNGERALLTVSLRSAADGKVIRRLTAQATPGQRRGTEGLRCIAYSPDSKSVAAGGSWANVHVWDTATGAERCRVGAGIYEVALAFAPDSRTLAVADSRNRIRLYDPATGKELPRPRGLLGGPYGMALTPDGRTLVTPGGDASLVLWDPSTGQERRRLRGPEESGVAGLLLSADGKTIISQGTDQKVRVWDVASGKIIRELTGDHFSRRSRLIAVTAEGKSFALIDEKPGVKVIDTVTGKVSREFSVGPAQIRGVAFLADRPSLVVWSGDRKAREWDLTTGKELRQVQYTEGPARTTGRTLPPPMAAGGREEAYFIAAVSPDGRRIAFGSNNGLIAVHDLVTGRELRRVEGLPDSVGILSFSPDGRTLAWVAFDDTKVRFLEVSTGKERHVLAGHTGRVVALSFPADGRTFASGSADTTALVWDLAGKRMPKTEGLDGPWEDLRGADAARAYQAVRLLAASPTLEEFLAKKVRPTPAEDAARVAKLIAGLDSDQFETRSQSTKGLEALGDRAAGELRKALVAGPSPETRRRIDALLKRLDAEATSPSAERVRLGRALEALELAGARKLLGTLAAGAPGAWLTEEARASLARLKSHGR